MANKIQIRRGLKANLPALSVGELGLCTDTNELYIGTSSGNVKVDTNTVYTHPTTAGNKHIPSGGTAGQVLKYSADGTAVWGTDNDTVYTHPTTAGNKHIPSGGASGQILKYSASGTAVWGENDKQSKVVTCTCETAASTVAKAITLSDYTLTAGDIFAVTYTLGNTANSATISINGGTAIQVRLGGGQPTGASGTGGHYIAANNTVLYYYNGTYMCLMGSQDITDANTTYSDATTSAAGLMSATDKTKLNGIADNANNYSHPTATGNKHIPSGGASGQVLKYSADGTAVWGTDNDTVYTHPTTAGNKHIPSGGASGQILRYSADGTAAWSAENNTTYSAATTSAAGLMSATDKTKLDGIDTGANKYTHPTTAGNKHIPSGGATGQVLKYSADGTAVWGMDNGIVNNTTVSNSFGIGTGALIENTGGCNVAVGHYALWKNTTGIYNTAVGQEALNKNTTGLANVAVGYDALFYNTTGGNNVAVGNDALRNNITGNHNTAVGNNALYSNTAGIANVAVGRYALYNNIEGGYNTAVGHHALYNNAEGGNNVAVGNWAGMHLSNGTSSQTTANNSIFIGDSSRGSANNAQTNQIVIGYGATGGGSNTITLGNSAITQLRCQVTAITALSDSRTKEYAEPADLDLCLEAVKNLPVSRYKYEKFTGKHLDENVTGFLADDVEKVFPKSVTKSDRHFPVLDENGEQVYEEIEEIVKDFDDDGNEIERVEKRTVEKTFLMEDVKEITMTEAIPTLWGALQAMINKVETMEKRIIDLESKVA